MPQWNAYGTGKCWDPTGTIPYNASATMADCMAGKYSFGGSGMFTTRFAEEFLLGYSNAKPESLLNALIPISRGLGFPGIFGNATVDFSAPPPGTKDKTTVYTGSDGDNSKVTFYKKYYGVDTFTTVNDLYDAGTQSRPTCVPFNPLLLVQRYSYSADCTVWTSAEAIQGTSDGFKAPYFAQEGKDALPIDVWVPEGQRVIRFTSTGSTTFKSIKMWIYNMDIYGLMNTSDSRIAPNSDQYASSLKHYMTNHPSGLASRQRADGFDSFISKPHFLDADLQLHHNQLTLLDIDGNPSNPTAANHDTYLYVEPLSGRTFSGRKRIQLGFFLSETRFMQYTFNGVYGMVVRGYPGNPDYVSGQGANNLYFPMLWGSEGKDISDDDANTFVNGVYGTRKTFMITQVVLVIFGGILFFVALVLCIKARQSGTTASM